MNRKFLCNFYSTISGGSIDDIVGSRISLDNFTKKIRWEHLCIFCLSYKKYIKRCQDFSWLDNLDSKILKKIVDNESKL